MTYGFCIWLASTREHVFKLWLKKSGIVLHLSSLFSLSQASLEPADMVRALFWGPGAGKCRWGPVPREARWIPVSQVSDWGTTDPGCPFCDSTDLLSKVELGEGEGPQVDALRPDLRLEFLPELVFHNHA